MSTSPNDDAASQDPHRDAPSDQSQEQRPQPRYGAYAPNDGPSDSDNKPDTPSAAESSSVPPSGSQYNPYGEPTWGQSGAGHAGSGASGGGQPGGWQSGDWQQGYQNPSGSPYGAPQNQPAWQQAGGSQQPTTQQGGYPPQAYAAPERPKRPGTLWGALAALLTAGVTALIWGIYVFVTLPTRTMDQVFGGGFSDAFVEEMERQSAQDPELQNLSAQEMEEVTLLGIGAIALVWAFVLLALYVTSAFLGSMAGNVGRILATIWAGLSLLFFFLGFDGISYGIIFATVALSIVAIVLMWLPASSQYIRHRKWEKEVSRSGYYNNPAQQ